MTSTSMCRGQLGWARWLLEGREEEMCCGSKQERTNSLLGARSSYVSRSAGCCDAPEQISWKEEGVLACRDWSCVPVSDERSLFCLAWVSSLPTKVFSFTCAPGAVPQILPQSGPSSPVANARGVPTHRHFPTVARPGGPALSVIAPTGACHGMQISNGPSNCEPRPQHRRRTAIQSSNTHHVRSPNRLSSFQNQANHTAIPAE